MNSKTNKRTISDLKDVGPRNPFINMVNSDIQRCEEYLSGDHEEKAGMALHLELITKYPAYIKNFGDSLYNYDPRYGFVSQEFFSLDSALHNLTVMKNRLVAFKIYGYKNPPNESSRNSQTINVENNLSATQTQSLTVSFENTKQQVEEMTGLSESDTAEVLDKIDQIKDIVEQKASKKTKWQKIKPILLWLADKSVDVGCALLPLVMKISEQ